MPIIIGETIPPKKMPNLNQILFKGLSILEFVSPKNKKIRDNVRDHILNSPLLSNGNRAINKKNIEKVKPKFLFEPILNSSFIIFKF